MLKSIIGKKVGMTQVFDDKGSLIPVTVIEAGRCVITNVRTVENDGYAAVQIAFGDTEEKKLSKPQAGLFKKYNLSPKKIVREIKVADVAEFSVGQEIKVDLFKVGDYVDVRAVSKGKGYAGVIKRHNFGMQPTTHGQSDRTRARGSSGGQGPQKVLKGTRMAGHLGNEYVTIQKLLVVGVDVEKNVLLIKGAVPAVNTGILLISNTLKKIPVVQEVKAKNKKK
ncbi:50S ribosomal protein L3 [Endomicrobiia bacterium]|nr:50S ribosomal protein L3 [Endomicrobiia bacterium]GHT67742.1 50S ribosomal protein L3 [Endomicrobiia bacterium]GHT69417.1 50S ribosomal protein L3 [Endomicrobiia bacterium]GHT73404.1 50S ribosomal protein L3 [Endomicrobiia bacterium]